MCAPAALAKMYAANDAQPIFGVPAKPLALRGKEEQGSGRMAYFEAAGIKISRSKADFAPTWLGWRDSNPRVTESKSVALPLGYIPIHRLYNHTKSGVNCQGYSWEKPATIPCVVSLRAP